MKKFKTVLLLVLVMVIAMATVTAQGAKDTGGKEETLYFVPKFTGFIFFELAGQGAQQACDELGVKMVTLGPTQDDIEGHVQILQNLIPQRPQMVVTTSSDGNAPVPTLKKMRENGAVVITFDSDVGEEGRDLYVNIAPYETQAKAILESALYNRPQGGKVIFLSPNPNIINHYEVEKWLKELTTNDPRYKVFSIIDTLYMDDDPDKAYSVALSAMQAYPDLVGFVTASGMANPAVNQAIQDSNRIGKIFCTGAGLPSTMETYLRDGVVQQFNLWSPYWFGYMSAWIAIQSKRGEFDISNGVTVDIPNIGKRSFYDTPGGLMTDLDMMVFFRKGHETFETSIPME